MFTFKAFRRINSSSKRGFTLLEIIAAIGLFAVMTLGVVSSLQEMNRLTLKLKSRQASVFSGALAMERLERDISMAYNERIRKSQSFFKWKESSAGPELSFSTFDSELRTLVTRRSPGIIAVRYRLEKEDNGAFTLIRSEAPFNNFEKIDLIKGQSIATGIVKLEYSFYDSQNDLWKKDWDTAAPGNPGVFPKAVKITIESVDPEIPSADWRKKSVHYETTVLVLNEIEDR